MRDILLRFRTVGRPVGLAVVSLFALACGANQDAATSPPTGASQAVSTTEANPGRVDNVREKSEEPVTSFHQLNARTIEGAEQSFSTYTGKVVLAVNTASACGFTPQYAGLEALWKQYKDKGLVVLGFPSNDFGGQEPGSDKEVQSFCQVRYGVTFPLFSKSVVKGEDASPVFRFLAAKNGEPQWNFHKYLVDKHGAVVSAFGSKVAPDDGALRAAIDKALAAP